MSDIKSDKSFQLMLESIANKMNNSPVLNGGFDRLMVVVEHIQKKQDETIEKVDKIHDAVYDPKEGLYARVQMVETVAKQFAEKQSAHLQADEANMSAINASLKKLAEADDKHDENALITAKLQKIAGDDLEKLEPIVKARTFWSEAISKGAWLLVGGGLAAAGKALWDVLMHR